MRMLYAGMLFAALLGLVSGWSGLAVAQSGAGAWGVNGKDEDHSELSGGFPIKDVNPDEDLRQRLVVEWERPRLGYMHDFDFDDLKEGEEWTGPDSEWRDDDTLRPNRELAFRGQLLVESPDGKSRRPIDWFQGVRVIVSRVPEKTHDWSGRQEMADAVWGDELIEQAGKFQVRISTAGPQRAVGKDVRFQVAVSLAEKAGPIVTWRNTVGVLPRSVTMLSIPGPPPVSETMQIINGAPAYEHEGFNPAKLVRAVNHLRPMGKEQAIRELRAFLAIAKDSDEVEYRADDNIDTSSESSVFCIVRLLFEPNEAGQRLPPILTVPFAPVPADADEPLWPLFPLHLQDDVPFFMVFYGGMGGHPQPASDHVDWAEGHGRIRLQPLRPVDNPLDAAERLRSLPQLERLYAEEWPGTHWYPHRQAWNSIVDADPGITKQLAEPTDEDEFVPEWDRRAKAVSERNIHWSEAKQRYVID